MKEQLKGYPYIWAAIFLWGTQGTFGRLVMEAGIQPVALAAFRISLGGLAFLVIILLQRKESLRIRREDIPYFLIFGLITVGCLHGPFNFAIYYTGVATASILLYTAPAFVTVLSIFFFGEKPTLKRISALLLTLAGCIAITVSVDTLEFNRIGVLFGVVAGFSYGLWSVLSKKGLFRYSTAVLNFYSMLIGGTFLFFWAIQLGGTESVTLSSGGWLAVIVMAFFNSFLPNNFYVRGLHFMRPTKASIMANSKLVISIFLAYLIFREPFTLLKTAGFLLVATGILLIVSEDYRQFNKNTA